MRVKILEEDRSPRQLEIITESDDDLKSIYSIVRKGGFFDFFGMEWFFKSIKQLEDISPTGFAHSSARHLIVAREPGIRRMM